MRLKIIIPNSSEEFLKSQIESRVRMLSHGVEGEVICLPEGPVSLESGCDEALIAARLVRKVEGAQSEGYDAICIDCAADPVTRALREAVRIPVVSAGEAAMLFALSLGDAFSVITVLENTRRLIAENVRKYGLQDRCASVRSVYIPVLDLADADKSVRAIAEESRKALDLDGADVIVLGCTGMSGVVQGLRHVLGCPVVDPAEAGVRLAESLVRMGLGHSKKCYPKPPHKEVKGEYLGGLSVI